MYMTQIMLDYPTIYKVILITASTVHTHLHMDFIPYQARMSNPILSTHRIRILSQSNECCLTQDRWVFIECINTVNHLQAIKSKKQFLHGRPRLVQLFPGGEEQTSLVRLRVLLHCQYLIHLEADLSSNALPAPFSQSLARGEIET